MMIGIVDYGVGNLFSLEKACNKANLNYQVITTPPQVQACDTVLLPGVGAFPSAMTHLKRTGLDKAIIEAAAVGKRIIGVCLGMQLLLTESEEFGSTAGLHLIEGHVRKLPEILKFKVPNIGWCQVLVNETFREDYLSSFINKKDFYFAHSYYCDVNENTTMAYMLRGGQKVPAIISNHKNVFGIQFHPEISGLAGSLLFSRLVLG